MDCQRKMRLSWPSIRASCWSRTARRTIRHADWLVGAPLRTGKTATRQVDQSVVLTDCIDDDCFELLELVGLDDPLLERRFDFMQHLLGGLRPRSQV